MERDLGLRERKKLRCQSDLAEAAFRLVRSKGFDATTVEEIAAAAEVSPSTFFRYFGSKEAVLLGRGEGPLDGVIGALEVADSLEAVLAAVRDAADAEGARLDADPHGKERIRLIAANPALAGRQLQEEGRFEDAIALRLRALAGRDDILLPRLIAGAVLGALRAARRVWSEDPGDRSAKDYVEDAFRALDAHIQAPEGYFDRRGDGKG